MQGCRRVYINKKKNLPVSMCEDLKLGWVKSHCTLFAQYIMDLHIHTIGMVQK